MNKNVRVRIPLGPHVNALSGYRDIYGTQFEQKSKNDFFLKNYSLLTFKNIVMAMITQQIYKASHICWFGTGTAGTSLASVLNFFMWV